jgi:lipid-A-disaccharide synthase
MKKHLFIFAGEPSGDLHGAHLLQALKRILPDYHTKGVGGPQMRSQGLQTVMDMEDFAVMGFTDVLKSLPKLYQNFIKIRDNILESNPEAVIFIDYPGFNLRMAHTLRKKGYKGRLIHYICPSVWAWGKNRIKKMTQTLDLLLTIFPFEAPYFSHTPLQVEYVGNPLQEYIRHHHYDDHWHQKCELPKDKNLIAIFPGSRQGEIKRNLPKQLAGARLLRESDPNLAFGISCVSNHLIPLIQEIASLNHLKTGVDLFFVPKIFSYELMRDSQSAIAKSGTVTLELALHKRPTVVVYELSRLNHIIAKYGMRLNLPHYCIVNILCGKQVFPELIEQGFTSQNLYEQIRALHADGEARNACLTDCQKLQDLLQKNNASQTAAQAIAKVL